MKYLTKLKKQTIKQKKRKRRQMNVYILTYRDSIHLGTEKKSKKKKKLNIQGIEKSLK